MVSSVSRDRLAELMRFEGEMLIVVEVFLRQAVIDECYRSREQDQQQRNGAEHPVHHRHHRDKQRRPTARRTAAVRV